MRDVRHHDFEPWIVLSVSAQEVMFGFSGKVLTAQVHKI